MSRRSPTPDRPRRSGWTIDTLREHVEALLGEKDLRDQQRYDSQVKALEAALTAQQEAVRAAMAAAERAGEKVEIASEKRFDQVNEFRQLVQDIIASLMPRAEAEQRLTGLAEKVEELKLAVGKGAARGAGLAAGWGYLLGAVGLAAAIITAVLAIATHG
jgi:hypothetical protein